MSSFPETSSGGSGTLPRSSRGKTTVDDSPRADTGNTSSPRGVTCRGTGSGNRKQRPHSLYISALENSMTDKDGDGRESNSEILTKDDNDDSKDDDDNCGGGFIKAEVVSSSGTIVLSLICLVFCSFFHSFTIGNSHITHFLF